MKEIEEAIEKNFIYSAQMTVLFYGPFIFWFIWFFYDETKLAERWVIPKSFMIYYFLFSLVIIPFQLFIDTLYYNVTHLYHGVELTKAFEYWAERFANRRKYWAWEESDNLAYEQANRVINKNCFSWQHYAILTACSLGVVMIIFGVLTVVYTPVNPFHDQYIVIILAINHLLMKLFTYAILKMADRLKQSWERDHLMAHEGAKDQSTAATMHEKIFNRTQAQRDDMKINQFAEIQ